MTRVCHWERGAPLATAKAVGRSRDDRVDAPPQKRAARRAAPLRFVYAVEPLSPVYSTAAPSTSVAGIRMGSWVRLSITDA